MLIVVRRAFASRKTAHNWHEAGMSPDDHRGWLADLRAAIEPHKADLVAAFTKAKRLRLRVTIFGTSRRVRQLDVHDALAQVADQLTDVLFPREPGRPRPQTMDSHFWREEVEKIEDADPRVEIEVSWE